MATAPEVSGVVTPETAADVEAAAPQELAQTPGEPLADTGKLSKTGLVDGTTGKPVRYHKFKNGYGVKVWKGDVDGEFRVAALNPDGRVARGLPGLRRLPASLPVDDVNDIITQVNDLA